MRRKTKKIAAMFLCSAITSLMIVCVIRSAQALLPLYWKPAYPDYAPSGMSDFDQKQDNWKNPLTGQWTYCGPVAVANSLWWLDSEFEPGAVPPPAVSDGFGLVTAYGKWDDHDVKNVVPLVNDLAAYMNTNPVTGTEVHAMKQGIDSYLNVKGMNAYFYTHLYQKPNFTDVEFEVEKSQDVVLLLGFWQTDGLGNWWRFGGHFVTVAGVNSTSTSPTVAFSDPYIDAAEPAPHGVGWTGRVLPPPPHNHPAAPPDTVHNNASYVSQDIYRVVQPSPSPGGFWGFPDYNQYVLPPDLFKNFQNQNFPVELLPKKGSFDPSLLVYTEVEYAVVTSPWFSKGQYVDYAPSGMPDFGQKQNLTWTNPWPPNNGSWSYCGPTSVANSLWWYDSKFEPNSVPPPARSDGFPLVQSYNPSVWDDQDPRNVGPLIKNLAWYMDTDGQRTGIPHCGTDVFDMQAGIAQYLSDKGVNPLGDANGDGKVDMTDINIVQAAYGSKPGYPKWDLRADVVHDNVIDVADLKLVTSHFGENWGKFNEKTVSMPDFGYIAHQIQMCEDVVLLLGFWQEMSPGYYVRIGGHFVTAHGVDEADMIIALSDPFIDNAEQGGQGRVIPPPPHNHPPAPPDTVHNNASFVSHDYYTVAQSPSPGGHWGLNYNWTSSLLNNFYQQNTPHNFTQTQDPYMGYPVYVEIEYAVVVSCWGPMVVAGSQDGNVYALDYMGNLLWTYNTPAPVVSVAMSEHGEYVVAGSLNNGLYVFNTAGALLWSKAIPISEGYSLDWRGSDSKTVGISADGSYIVAATMNGIYLYDNLGNLIWHFAGVIPQETCVKISPDGRYIVSTNYNNGEIHFFSHLRNGIAGWQPADGTPIWTNQIWAPTSAPFNWVAIDGCGRYVAFSADVNGNGREEVYLFDRAGNQIWSWEFNRTGFVRVDMPWDGRSVVAANADPTDVTGAQLVYFSDTHDGVFPGWGPGDGKPHWIFVPTPDVGGNDLYSVVISPDGKNIATGPATTSKVYLLSNLGAPIQTISNGVVNALDLTFTGEYGVEGDRVEPALTGTIRFFTKTRNTMLWSFATAGKINSVAIQKKYPCLEPFPNHDVDVSKVTRYTTPDGKEKHYVSQGFPANAINITLSNHGGFTETVEVTLYAYSSTNNTMIVAGNSVVTIAPGTAPIISITWNVSSTVPYYGNYTLHATIGPVQDENNLTDNEFIDTGLVVTGPYDVNGDRKVNLVDVFNVALAFGSKAGDAAYKPDLDVNCDYKINLVDYFNTALRFGRNYP
jgi:hypothetical protein